MMSDTLDIALNTWKISCHHTPETVDKIMMNFRKRGMVVNKLEYRKVSEELAECIVEFEDTPLSSHRIYQNIQRIYDIIDVTIL